MPKKIQALGILACKTSGDPPFSDHTFYSRLSRIGLRLGLPVFVFTPSDADKASSTVSGFLYQAKDSVWQHRQLPLPDLIYDRVFFVGSPDAAEQRASLRRLRRHRERFFLGRQLPGKWQVYQSLRSSPSVSAHLPHTELFRGCSGAEVRSLNPRAVHKDAALLPFMLTAAVFFASAAEILAMCR
jgi:hypothetical protein